MVWVRLDDKLRKNRKWRRASSDAKVMYVEALCYANDNTTDGRLTSEAITELAFTNHLDTERCGQELVDIGLWEAYSPDEGDEDDGEGGFWIHDYSLYQPTRDKLARQRELKRQRQARWRAGQRTPDPGSPGRFVDASVDASVVASRDASTNGVHRKPTPTGLHMPSKHVSRAGCDPIDLEELRQAKRVM